MQLCDNTHNGARLLAFHIVRAQGIYFEQTEAWETVPKNRSKRERGASLLIRDVKCFVKKQGDVVAGPTVRTQAVLQEG